MKFDIEDSVFSKLPNLCVGVVVAKNVDNHKNCPDIKELFDSAMLSAQQRYSGKKVKEAPEILPYREAFRTCGINPNKYMCSIEALFSRLAKGMTIPNINPLVDLNNALSIRTTLPMGTHDLGDAQGDIVLRFAKEDDAFVPFGSTEAEHPEVGELVYAIGNDVRTRRWTWRQSEHGKITPNTTFVFFPIDGFIGVNDAQVNTAIKTLDTLLHKYFHCDTVCGVVDRYNPEIEF